jgi:hypothetical protein
VRNNLDDGRHNVSTFLAFTSATDIPVPFCHSYASTFYGAEMPVSKTCPTGFLGFYLQASIQPAIILAAGTELKVTILLLKLGGNFTFYIL